MADGQRVGGELRERLGGGGFSVMVRFWTDEGYKQLIWTPRDGPQRGGSQGSPRPACVRQLTSLKGNTTEKVESRSGGRYMSQESRNGSDWATREPNVGVGGQWVAQRDLRGQSCERRAPMTRG